MADHGEVILESDLAQRMFFGFEQLLSPGITDTAGLFDRSAVIGQLVRLDAGEQLGAAPDKEQALSQQGAQGPFVSGVNVRRGNEIGAQQVSELFGVDAVILIFAAVNGFDIEGMGQDARQTGRLSSIGQPIPAEHALAADGQVMLVGPDQLEEELEVVVPDVGMDQFFPLAIHDADVHLTCVQIDSAVELCGGSIILHMLTQ